MRHCLTPDSFPTELIISYEKVEDPFSPPGGPQRYKQGPLHASYCGIPVKADELVETDTLSPILRILEKKPSFRQWMTEHAQKPLANPKILVQESTNKDVLEVYLATGPEQIRYVITRKDLLEEMRYDFHRHRDFDYPQPPAKVRDDKQGDTTPLPELDT